MNRKQLYYDIKKLNLQNEVKKVFGKNFTNCTTEQLYKIVNARTSSDSFITSIKPISQVASKEDRKFYTLINTLAKKKILLNSEVKEILNS